MGKLRVLSGREVCKILEAEGFSEVRRRGSHIVMQKRSENTTTTVPAGCLAALVPALRAAKVDPASSLRAE